MVNDPKIMNEVIDNIKKISKEDLENAMFEADKELTMESFNKYIQSIESEQNTLYDNEDYHKDDIEQNELTLLMLRKVVKIVNKQTEIIKNLKESKNNERCIQNNSNGI